MYSGIYKIESKDGKIYIGSAVNIKNRWSSHKSKLTKNKHHSKHLQRAWNKYGADYFTFSILEVVEDKSKLIYYEQVWINIMLSSLDSHDIYNECKIAGSSLGRKLTKEQLKKHSEIRKGKCFTEEHKNALSGTYKLISPEGVITEITNLRAFCRKYGYAHSNFSRLLNGRCKSAYKWKRIEHE